MGAMDDLFGKMATAPTFTKGVYMSEGDFEIVVRDIGVNTSQNPLTPGASFFVCEFEIEKSNRPEAHPVGCVRSYLLTVGGTYFLGDCKKLMTALLGYDPQNKKHIEDQNIQGLVALFTAAQCGGDQALKTLGALFTPGMFKGAKLHLECTARQGKPTVKNPSGIFTNHVWSPLPGARVFGA